MVKLYIIFSNSDRFWLSQIETEWTSLTFILSVVILVWNLLASSNLAIHCNSLKKRKTLFKVTTLHLFLSNTTMQHNFLIRLLWNKISKTISVVSCHTNSWFILCATVLTMVFKKIKNLESWQSSSGWYRFKFSTF